MITESLYFTHEKTATAAATAIFYNSPCPNADGDSLKGYFGGYAQRHSFQ